MASATPSVGITFHTASMASETSRGGRPRICVAAPAIISIGCAVEYPPLIGSGGRSPI
jgi:hypothetical protein